MKTRETMVRLIFLMLWLKMYEMQSTLYKMVTLNGTSTKRAS